MFADIIGVYVLFYKHSIIVRQDVTYKNVICQIRLIPYRCDILHLNEAAIQQPIFTATMEVPSEVLQKLVCENCDGYLSRGPVLLMDNVRYRCGRCLPSEEEPGTRIEAYEELAKLMTFPCRYQPNGCPSKVPFAENEAHEEACQYRKHNCPIADSGECVWTGIQTELLEHCRRHHPDNVVENPCKLTHNITRFSLHNYLLWTLGVLFLLQTKVCIITRKIYHSVRLIGDPASASDYKYTLSIQNKDSIFSKQRAVVPRGCLALQNDSSIQTDIIALLTMLEDFEDTTFTVTVESLANRTAESSTAEPNSQGTNSANTHDTTLVQTIEATVMCDACQILTEPVYREGWLCRSHAPEQLPCKNSTKGCTYSGNRSKCEKHKQYYCQYRTRCVICLANITSTTLNAHYTQAHGVITYRVGTVCTITPAELQSQYLIIDCDFGKVVCWYRLNNSDFTLSVYTPLPSEQLYKYRCSMKISHPDTGHSRTSILPVRYNRTCDWYAWISQTDFNTYSQNNRMNIKININRIEDSSEIIL